MRQVRAARTTVAAAVVACLAASGLGAQRPDTVRAAASLDVPAAEALGLFEDPARWPAAFRDVTHVDVEEQPSGRRVAVSSPSASHAHTLAFARGAGPGTLVFSFVDDDHPVSFEGRVVVVPSPQGSEVVIEVALDRQGLLALVPDAWVERQVEVFLEGILADARSSLAPPARSPATPAVRVATR